MQEANPLQLLGVGTRAVNIHLPEPLALLVGFLS